MIDVARRKELANSLLEVTHGSGSIHLLYEISSRESEDVGFRDICVLMDELLCTNFVSTYTEWHQEPEEKQALVRRCVAFLLSDCEYEWPNLWYGQTRADEIGGNCFVAGVGLVGLAMIVVWFDWTRTFFTSLFLGYVLAIIGFQIERRAFRRRTAASFADPAFIHWPFRDESVCAQMMSNVDRSLAER